MGDWGLWKTFCYGLFGVEEVDDVEEFFCVAVEFFGVGGEGFGIVGIVGEESVEVDES